MASLASAGRSSRARVGAGARRRARPARRRAGRSRRAARRCSASRAASSGVARPRRDARPAATASSTDSALGSGLAALGARTSCTGLLRDQAFARRASGRSRASPTASSAMLRGAAPGAVQLRHPAADVVRLAPGAAARPRRAAERCRRSKASPYSSSGARRQPPLDRADAPDGATMSASRAAGVAFGRRIVGRHRRTQPPGSSRDSAALGQLADALQEVGAHVGGEARRVGRGQHQQAEGAGAALVAQRDQRDRRRLRRIVEPVDGLEAGVDAAVRRAEAGGEARDLVVDAAARTASPRTPRPRPRPGSPPAAPRTRGCSSRSSTSGRSAALAVSSSARVQRCSRSAMTTFSLPLRIISISCCSKPLIFSRSISTWRSCRLTARLPCGLVELHRRQQLGMALEEVGRVGQVVGDVVFGDALHAGRRRRAHRALLIVRCRRCS